MAQTRLIVNTDIGQTQISKYIYGHFAEHLGHCIYGGIWVGRDSEIPNTRGIRNDVVEALRGIAIPVLRWPGGCFADEYHWMDGIGPAEQRPTMINTHWGGVTENNAFGTHEFMDLCEQLGCEPYICGNLGSGTVREMQQWIEYLNLEGVSPMADLRKANGHPAPWGVRFWGVGNENWGCGGQMRPEYYADQYRRYACYCRNFSEKKLYKIACGANSFDYRWTEVLMREAGNRMDGLSLHYYTSPGTSWERKLSATEFGEDEWFITLKKALAMEELVTRHAAIMDQYDPTKRVGMMVDEWGTWYKVEPGTNPGFLFQQNTLRDALVAGLTLNIFNQHCDRVQMANIAQTVNVLQAMVLTDGAAMIVTPSYHAFELYKVHQDAIYLPSALETPQYTFGDDHIPAVSASASRAADGTVAITLCNLDPNQAQDLVCELRGMQAAQISGRALTADAMNAHNTFAQPEAVIPTAFDGVKIVEGKLVGQIPAKSVVLLTVK